MVDLQDCDHATSIADVIQPQLVFADVYGPIRANPADLEKAKQMGKPFAETIVLSKQTVDVSTENMPLLCGWKECLIMIYHDHEVSCILQLWDDCEVRHSQWRTHCWSQRNGLLWRSSASRGEPFN